jgi:hypothetical protein
VIAKVDGRYFVVEIVDEGMAEVKLGKELFPKNPEMADKHCLLSLFKTEDGKDHPFPRYLDPIFAQWGLYRPANMPPFGSKEYEELKAKVLP